MDRYHRKKDKHEISELNDTVLNAFVSIFVTIFLLSLWNGTIYAETQKEEEKKIELEKVQILGVLERPNVVFPLRWKDPEGPEERSYKLQRSFKEEIFDFGDVDSIEGSRG